MSDAIGRIKGAFEGVTAMELIVALLMSCMLASTGLPQFYRDAGAARAELAGR